MSEGNRQRVERLLVGLPHGHPRAARTAGGLDVDAVVAHLWEFEGGLAVRLRMFGDAEKAKARFPSDDD